MTEVTQLGSGVVFIYLNHKIPSEVPSLASIRELVAADAMRDRQETGAGGTTGFATPSRAHRVCRFVDRRHAKCHRAGHRLGKRR